MASAGRILIMPKGNYDSGATYEMLDLVFYDGASWVAKKTVVGIEPSDTNSEYWQRMVEGADLSPYAKLTVVDGLVTEVDDLEAKVGTLEETVNGISSSGLRIATGSYTGTGTAGSSSPNSITFDLEPKVVLLPDAAVYSGPVVWHKGTTVLTLGLNGSNDTNQLQFELEGDTLKWYSPLSEADTQLNSQGAVYHWVAIG